MTMQQVETIGRDELKALTDDEIAEAIAKAEKTRRSYEREKRMRATRLLKLAPYSDKPQTALQLLAREHWRLVQHSVRLSNAICDKKVMRGPDKGKVIPCMLPEDVKADQKLMAEGVKSRADKMQPVIEAQLELMEVYRVFLRDVFGCGSVVAGYLLSEIDIRREGLKPSGVRRYCGYAVIDGKAERPRKDNQRWIPAEQARNREPHPLKELDERETDSGTEVLVKMPLCYNAMLKSRLWQMMTAMRRNASKCTNNAPYGVTNKYLEVWYNAKRAAQTMQGMKPGKADSKGMRKAVDLFLLDLYTVWRSIEGLDVWPSYYDSRRGFEHGGIPLHEQGPRRFSTEAALQMVGDFKTTPLPEKRKWTMASDETEPEDVPEE
ncbi:MAG: hypothetical protein WC683_16190 [bacterium]